MRSEEALRRASWSKSGWLVYILLLTLLSLNCALFPPGTPPATEAARVLFCGPAPNRDQWAGMNAVVQAAMLEGSDRTVIAFVSKVGSQWRRCWPEAFEDLP